MGHVIWDQHPCSGPIFVGMVWEDAQGNVCWVQPGGVASLEAESMSVVLETGKCLSVNLTLFSTLALPF